MRATAAHGAFVAVFGWETSGLGFFLTVTRDRKKLAEYDALRRGYDGLPGLLRTLVTAGVVDDEAVIEAVHLLPHIERADEIDDAAARFVADVILRLRQVAAA